MILLSTPDSKENTHELLTTFRLWVHHDSAWKTQGTELLKLWGPLTPTSAHHFIVFPFRKVYKENLSLKISGRIKESSIITSLQLSVSVLGLSKTC